jgi:hypothetical protein
MELLVASQVELLRMIKIAPSIERKLLARVARQSPAMHPEVAAMPRRAQVIFTT